VLLVFKIKDIFKKKNPTQKCVERAYSIDKFFIFEMKLQAKVIVILKKNKCDS